MTPTASAAATVAFRGPRLRDLRGATLLIGSGLSGHRDNGLPAGGQVAERIFERLLSYPGLDRARFWRWAWTTPFEQLLNDHPFPDEVQAVFRRVYNSARVNPFQRRLAELALNGHVGAIVTTNYDCCIEGALAAAGVAFQVVVDPADAVPPGTIPVFKIHGSADRGQPLVLNLGHEGMLPPWKDALLRRLCEGADVYVLGYSGRDFDICPTLLSANYQTLSWLETPSRGDQPDDPFAFSAHVRYALENPALVPRFELVLGYFGDVLDESAPWVPAANADAVVDEMFAREKVSPNAFRLWSATLFQAISCRAAAERVLPTVVAGTASETLRALHLLSDLGERAGAYLASERALAEVARRREASGEWDEAVRAAAQRAWRLFTGAHLPGFLAARLRLARMVRSLERTKPAGADLALARARLAYVNLLAASMLRFVPGGRAAMRVGAIRRRLGATLGPALDAFRGRGLWQERYLLANQAKELGVEDVAGSIDRVLPASFGFGQLGNLVGDTSAYRRSGRDDPGRALLLLDGLREYGLGPEYWKFYHEFREQVRTLPGNTHSAADALRAYRACELGALGRWIHRRKVGDLRREAASTATAAPSP